MWSNKVGMGLGACALLDRSTNLGSIIDSVCVVFEKIALFGLIALFVYWALLRDE